jgi:hypothetical protein
VFADELAGSAPQAVDVDMIDTRMMFLVQNGLGSDWETFAKAMH